MSIPFTQLELGQQIKAYVSAVTESLRSSAPIFSQKELDEIDGNLLDENDVNVSKPSRLPDEATFFILEQAGAQLYAIGAILELDQGLLPPIAALTRSVVEHCAKALFLCDGISHEVRTVSSNNDFNEALKENGALKPSHPLHRLLNNNQNWVQRGKQCFSSDLPKRSSTQEVIVRTYLSDLCPVETYKELHTFVHPNAASAMIASLNAGANPDSKWSESVYFALLAVQCFNKASDEFAQLRDIGEFEEVVYLIDSLTKFYSAHQNWQASISPETWNSGKLDGIK